MKKIHYIVLPVVALVALGGYAYYAQRTPLAPTAGTAPSTAPDEGKSANGNGKSSADPVAVEAIRVEATDVQEDVVAVGTVRSNESVVVRPEVSGRITQLNFSEGGRVGKGQLLVQLDPSIAAAEVQQAKANLKLAQANYDRTVELRKDNFVSEAAQDQALNNLRVVEATVALAEARLAKMAIRAPFSGVIGIRQVSVGDYVKEGQDLVTLEDTSSLKVDFRLPEMLTGVLEHGQRVEVRSDAFAGKRYVATLDAIDPVVDQNGRALVLLARLRNVEGQLRPGMFVQTRVILSQRQGALMVPEEALMAVGGEQRVYRVQGDNKVEQRTVATGLRRDGRVEITEGLQAGDVVVTAGHLKLRPGATVKVAQEDATVATPNKGETPTAPQVKPAKNAS
ncbi:MAG TPA: efflux RND transporter periplasmic adaptor subunit [Burkholderiales bacterium]